MATRAILGPASVYTSHVKIASDKAIKFSSTTDPDSGTYDLTLERASAATAKLTDGAGGVAKLNAVSGGTGQTAYAVGDLLYASSTTALSRLAVGTDGWFLKLASGLPTWAASSTSTLASVLAAGNTTSGTSIVVSSGDSITGGDAATGTELALRGGNGSAGVGGLISATGGNGVGTNQNAGGFTASSGKSSGAGTAFVKIKTAPVGSSGTSTNTDVDQWAFASSSTNVTLTGTSTGLIGWAASTDPTASQDTWFKRNASNVIIATGATGNRATSLCVISPSSGTVSYGSIQVSRDNDAGSCTLNCYSSSFTTSGIYTASGTYLTANGTDNLNLGTASSGVVRVFQNNAFATAWGSSYLGHVSGLQMSWSSSSSDPTSTKDVGLARDAAGILRLTNGSTGYGTLAASTIVPTAITGSNQAGTALTVGGGLGTGTGVPGLWKVQTGIVGSSGSTAHVAADRIYVGTKTLSLSDNVATTFAKVSVASGAMCSGHVFFSGRASNGTDHQVQTHMMAFSAVNKAGTLTVGSNQTNGSGSNSTGTLTFAGSVSAGTNEINLIVTSDTTLTPTLQDVTYTIILNGPGLITPQ